MHGYGRVFMGTILDQSTFFSESWIDWSLPVMIYVRRLGCTMVLFPHTPYAIFFLITESFICLFSPRGSSNHF